MALPQILERFERSWKEYRESQSQIETPAQLLRKYPDSRRDTVISSSAGEVCEPAPWELAENRRKAALEDLEMFLREDLLPLGAKLSGQLVKQKPKEDPRLLLKFLLLLAGDEDDRETAGKLWPDLLVELKACELRSTKGNVVRRKPRRVATEIKRDLRWLREYEREFENREGGGVNAFARSLRRPHDTVSKALSRARRHRTEAKIRRRESASQS